jgi:hypothetical protein
MSAQMTIGSMSGARIAATPSAVLIVYAGALLQGMTLVSFPAVSAMLKQTLALSDADYGAIFLPQVALAIVGAVAGGRVLVLLGACHSGATTVAGSPLSMDSTDLRTILAAANVSVPTSSTGAEMSFEKPELQHGAFIKALLDAFDDPAADINRNGQITPNGLAAYIATRVPMLTGDKQHPGMEVRYDTTLFARSR